MCGVVALYAYSGAAPPADREELRVIRDHMAARGPDGVGEWFSSDGRVALGHRRLSIIDLSDRAAQPMQYPESGLSITFNGEIYNFRELRDQLQRSGRQFRTDSDTEVLLQLYAQHGEEMLPMLRGMFAFAIWDAPRQCLFMGRDPFGIKPLYYSDDGSTVRVASQVKALCAGGKIDTSPRPAGHAGFFLWGSVPAPWTLYRGIRSLPAGCSLTVSAGRCGEPRQYCSVTDVLAEAEANPARGSRQDALSAIASAIRDSVAAHLVSDVPVASFLSAGLDSAMITSLAAAGGARPSSLTLTFAEFSGTPDDEAPMAERLAAQFGTRHATLMTSKADFEADRDRLLAAMDQPSIDGVNTWFIAKAAASQGIKVALSGLGGDELLASYPSFSQLPAMVRLARPMRRITGSGAGLRKAVGPVIERFTSPKYAGLAEYGSTLGGAYLLRRALFMPWELEGLMDPDLAREGWAELQALAGLERTSKGIRSSRLCVTALESSYYMRHQLLRDTDWASMAQSLEMRVPFVDIELYKAIAPWLVSFPQLTKQEVALAVCPRLPRAVVNKRKTGFSVPVRDWLAMKGDQVAVRGMRGWARQMYAHYTGSLA